jgi:hypothetical protein
LPKIVLQTLNEFEIGWLVGWGKVLSNNNNFFMSQFDSI